MKEVIIVFTATSFIFDGVPSEEYGVMLYFLDDVGTVEDELWTNDIVEDRLNTRYDPIFYGININKQMTFNLTVGSTEYMSRYDVERVADWLTSHNTYKWLDICQDDMRDFRYKAMFTEVKTVHINGLPVAFNCTVVTDSQFAYERPVSYSYIIHEGKVLGKTKDGRSALFESTNIFNKSSYNGYLYPTMSIKINDGCEKFSIINTSDKNRTFTLTAFPNNSASIADIFSGTRDRFFELDDKMNEIVPVRDKLLSFISQYKGSPDQSASNKITDKIVDSYLSMSVTELEALLRDLELELSEFGYHERFIPTSSDSYIVTPTESFMVLENFSDVDYIDLPSQSLWTSDLRDANSDYFYENYNLISAYNYHVTLENDSNTNIELFEVMAKVNLLRAIVDFIPLNEEAEEIVASRNYYFEQYNSYGTAGNEAIDGDELVVEVDNKNQIMTCNRDGLNIYEYFGDDYGNHHFLRLVKGKNVLTFEGSGVVTITCEFLRKVGV